MGQSLGDLVGKRFGRWTVLKYANNDKKIKRWHCLCDCGNEKIVIQQGLVRGLSTSCGCKRKETLNKLKKHGMVNTKFYEKWKSMKLRCLCKTIKAYPNYGGRGIRLSEKWIEFNGFKEDMYDSFLEHLKEFGNMQTTLDRIDNNGNYCKENCRWATRKEQQYNRRITKLIEYNGEKLTITKWGKKLGIDHVLIYRRLKRGKLPLEKVFSSKKYRNNQESYE